MTISRQAQRSYFNFVVGDEPRARIWCGWDYVKTMPLHSIKIAFGKEIDQVFC